MGLFQIIWWLLFGLIVGAIARYLLPGKHEMNLLMTIALGVACSFVGGAISWLMFGGSSYMQAAGWRISIVGAFLWVLVYSKFMGAKKKPKSPPTMQNEVNAMRVFTIAGLLLGGLLAAAGCQESELDRWAEAQKSSSAAPQAVAVESVEGSAFNRFFPQAEKPWDIVFKQEKTGFAQASLQNEGREMAVLSVSDTKNNPAAADKYRGAEAQLAGLPRAEIDADTTGVLAGDRYQVQIRSMDPAFGPQERETWLAKFNLEAIGRIH